MLHLSLCVVPILAAAAAQPGLVDGGLNSLVGDYRSLRSNLLDTDRVTYSAFLKDLKVAEEKVQNALLKKPTKESDPNLHVLLVLGVVDAYAHSLIGVSPSSDTFKYGYQSVVNKQLPLLLKNPVKASQHLASDLAAVKLALKPLLDLVGTLCVNVDFKTCDELVQLSVDKNQELKDSVDVLTRTHSLAEQYLSLVKEVELAAKKLGGVGYVLNNVLKLGKLSQLFSNVLLNLKPVPSPKPTSRPTPRPTRRWYKC